MDEKDNSVMDMEPDEGDSESAPRISDRER
jgi:hypothetical protein